MLFTWSLYASLIVFATGMLWRLGLWLRHGLGGAPGGPGARLAAVAAGVGRGVFSARLPRLVWALVAEGLFLRRLWRESPGRWLMHSLIYWGFLGLVLMHACQSWFSYAWLPDYEPTLNPYYFLRDLFGAMVLAGAAVAVYRRLTDRALRKTTGTMDWLSVALVLGIILSGLGLEATKTISHRHFERMLTDYAALDPQETDNPEVAGLAAFWQTHYDVVFPQPVPVDEDILTAGAEAHENYCASCHVRPGWAFASWPLVQALKPVAAGLDGLRADEVLWHLHYLLVFAGLAWLPFGKMRHLVLSPLSLMVNAALDEDTAPEELKAVRRGLDLDACTHCAVCSAHCSVGLVHEFLPNDTILPSEKLAAARTLALGGGLDQAQLERLRQGDGVCTRCRRCTAKCPVGLNLQELWLALDRELTNRGVERPRARMARITGQEFRESRQARQGRGLSLGALPQPGGKEAAHLDSFYACYSCQTCTNVCPVVFSHENPREALGLLPHQIIHALRLGLEQEAVGAGMTWQCLTCYKCQEACPQGVQVADILYELRNRAFRDHAGWAQTENG